jgi:hypothetical protein
LSRGIVLILQAKILDESTIDWLAGRTWRRSADAGAKSTCGAAVGWASRLSLALGARGVRFFLSP